MENKDYYHIEVVAPEIEMSPEEYLYYCVNYN